MKHLCTAVYYVCTRTNISVGHDCKKSGVLEVRIVIITIGCTKAW